MNNYHEARVYFIILILLMGFSTPVFGQGIPEEARRYMARGMAAVEMAKSPGDYVLAMLEFEEAAKLAPDWPDVYYNLGNVQIVVGDFTSAIKNFQRYLELAPTAPDEAKVREQIFKLEYRRDRQKFAMTLTGPWTSADGQKFNLLLDGTRLQLTRTVQRDYTCILKSMGVAYPNAMKVPPMVFSGTLIGDKISGQYQQAAGNGSLQSSVYCNIPEQKGHFEGTVDVAAGQMRLVYNRVTLEYEMKFKSMLSAELTCRVTKRQEMPGYVLELKRDPPTPVQTGN